MCLFFLAPLPSAQHSLSTEPSNSQYQPRIVNTCLPLPRPMPVSRIPYPRPGDLSYHSLAFVPASIFAHVTPPPPPADPDAAPVPVPPPISLVAAVASPHLALPMPMPMSVPVSEAEADGKSRSENAFCCCWCGRCLLLPRAPPFFSSSLLLLPLGPLPSALLHLRDAGTGTGTGRLRHLPFLFILLILVILLVVIVIVAVSTPSARSVDFLHWSDAVL